MIFCLTIGTIICALPSLAALGGDVSTVREDQARIHFSIANADALFAQPGDFVFATLGGPNSGTFDWGLPFFFGRNVYTAIESRSTPAGAGPFWAY